MTSYSMVAGSHFDRLCMLFFVRSGLDQLMTLHSTTFCGISATSFCQGNFLFFSRYFVWLTTNLCFDFMLRDNRLPASLYLAKRVLDVKKLQQFERQACPNSCMVRSNDYSMHGFHYITSFPHTP